MKVIRGYPVTLRRSSKRGEMLKHNMLQMLVAVKLLVLLLSCCFVEYVVSTHFRGAIITVTPHQGGATREVSTQ